MKLEIVRIRIFGIKGLLDLNNGKLKETLLLFVFPVLIP